MKKINRNNNQQITVINKINKLLQYLYTVKSERFNSARFRTQKAKSQTWLSDWRKTADVNLSSIIKCQFTLPGHSSTATEIVKKSPYFLNYLKKAERSCEGRASSRQIFWFGQIKKSPHSLEYSEDTFS